MGTTVKLDAAKDLLAKDHASTGHASPIIPAAATKDGLESSAIAEKRNDVAVQSYRRDSTYTLADLTGRSGDEKSPSENRKHLAKN